MGAGDNKALAATCAGCGKEYPSQRDANVPQITGFPVRVNGMWHSVPLCRACVGKGIRPEDVVKPAPNAVDEST
jgi:NAD-dependent SIR2 family protein deacetylase